MEQFSSDRLPVPYSEPNTEIHQTSGYTAGLPVVISIECKCVANIN